jgi:hypothetical protein
MERLVRIASSGRGRLKITTNPGIKSRKMARQMLSKEVCSHGIILERERD